MAARQEYAKKQANLYGSIVPRVMGLRRKSLGRDGATSLEKGEDKQNHDDQSIAKQEHAGEKPKNRGLMKYGVRGRRIRRITLGVKKKKICGRDVCGSNIGCENATLKYGSFTRISYAISLTSLALGAMKVPFSKLAAMAWIERTGHSDEDMFPTKRYSSSRDDHDQHTKEGNPDATVLIIRRKGQSSLSRTGVQMNVLFCVGGTGKSSHSSFRDARLWSRLVGELSGTAYCFVGRRCSLSER